MYLYTRNVCLGYKNDLQYIYFFINKLYINLTVRKNMIIRTAFSFYEPRLSYTIFQNIEICSDLRMNHKSFRFNEKWMRSWRGCFIKNRTRQMRRESTRDKQSVTHKNGRQLFTIFGTLSAIPNRSVSCGKHEARGKSSLGLGVSGSQNLDKRYQSINQQISSDHRRNTCDVTSCLPRFDVDQQTLMQYLK